MANPGVFEKLIRDPRHFQILTLSCLVVIQAFGGSFGPDGFVIFLAVGGCLLFQVVFSRLFRIPLDFRSPLISGLSLSILLKASSLWFFPLAALVAVGSKFLIRFRGKHVFNPTNIAIVVLLLVVPQFVWVSPGQWGHAAWLVFFLFCAALLVLYRIPRRDMGPMFLVVWAAVLFGRALWLGDPLAIPLHQMQSGALLIFCFFMISDPKTIPDRFAGRVIFALLVAGVAYIFQFRFFMTEGLLYGLALVSPLTPLIDKVLPGAAYRWGDTLKSERAHNKEVSPCIQQTT